MNIAYLVYYPTKTGVTRIHIEERPLADRTLCGRALDFERSQFSLYPRDVAHRVMTGTNPMAGGIRCRTCAKRSVLLLDPVTRLGALVEVSADHEN